MIHIYPSLMAADQLNLESEIERLKDHCAGFHLDVMDNHFVPNITWGISTINAIARISSVWVHLMIDNPVEFYNQLELRSGSIVSFHLESEIDFFYISKIVKEKKHKLSIAISPKTPISEIIPFLSIVDQVLLMSVEPGFSGNRFLLGTIEKLAELVVYRQQGQNYLRIGIDGGINKDNITQLITMGADDYAVGAGIFQQKDAVEALHELIAQ